MAKDLGATPAVATVLKVRKQDNRFIGDLHWSDGHVWTGWQVWRRLSDLKRNARCTFQGMIVRV